MSGIDGFTRRRLGNTGVEVSAIALGCYSMSSAYGARDDDESIRVINEAADAGINLFDTADYYGWGHNERLVGKALSTRRNDVLISTKFGYVPDDNDAFGLCSRPSYVRQAVDASLERLGTDHVDVLYQHRLDPEVPIEDTVGAMAELVADGKVRHIGLCEVSETTLRRAYAVHPITAVQYEYSLWTRDVETRMLAVFDELSITLNAFSPLARGMLSGALRSRDQIGEHDVRRRAPRFSEENFAKNLQLVDQLTEIAKDLGLSTSQLALAWLLNRNPAMVAVCGADTIAFLQENLGALDVRLNDDQIADISVLFEPGSVHGDRYHAGLMKLLDKS